MGWISSEHTERRGSAVDRDGKTAKRSALKVSEESLSGLEVLVDGVGAIGLESNASLGKNLEMAKLLEDTEDESQVDEAYCPAE